MNQLIVEQFNEVIKLIKAEILAAQLDNNVKEAERHSYRLKQTKRALQIILSLDFEILSESDIEGIPGIGKGTLYRVKQILETGKLETLGEARMKLRDPRVKAIGELLDIIGVGDRLARKLVLDHNITTVEQLREAVETKKIRVSPMVKLGLKYYNIVDKKIPRSEITAIEKYLVSKVKEIDPKLEIMICGSYRRGVSFSGDIDVMLYHPDVKFVRQLFLLEKHGLKSYLELLVKLLTEEGFLLDHMSVSKIKYMGFCRSLKKYVNVCIHVKYGFVIYI